MIDIIVNNTSLDLNPNMTIPWKMVNPLFVDEISFINDHSLEFNIPYSESNSLLLGHPQEITIRSTLTKIPAKLVLGGSLHYEGLLVIFKANDERYKVSIAINKSKLNLSLSIRSFIYEGSLVGVTPTTRDLDNTKTYPDQNYFWPTVSNKNLELEDQFGNTNVLASRMMYNWKQFGSAFTTSDVTILMPSFVYVVKQIFQELNDTRVVGVFLNDTDIEKLLIFNPVHTKNITNPITWQSSILFNGVNNLHLRIFRAADLVAGTIISFEMIRIGAFTDVWDITYTIVAADLIGDEPTVIANIMAKLNTELNLSTYIIATIVPLRNSQFIHIGNDPASGYDVAVDTQTEDYLTFKNVKLNLLASDPPDNLPHIAKHLPNMTVSEFLNAIRRSFNLYIAYDSVKNELELVPKFNLINNKSTDYSDKVLTDMDIESKEKTNYRFVWPADSEDDYALAERTHANNHPEHFEEGYEPLEFEISSPMSRTATTNISGAGVVSSGEMVEINRPMESYSDDGDFPLMLTKWLGLVNDSGSYAYPKIVKDSLYPNEMFTKWISDWYNLLSSDERIVYKEMKFDHIDLLNFDKKAFWLINNNKYVWMELDLEITMNGIKYAKAKLKKV